MPQYLTMSKWMELSQETRNALRDIFQICIQGPTEVENYGTSSKIISDGVYPQELIDKLTVAKMRDYCNSNETDFDLLFKNTLAIISGEVKEPEIVEQVVQPIQETYEQSTPTTKRKK